MGRRLKVNAIILSICLVLIIFSFYVAFQPPSVKAESGSPSDTSTSSTIPSCLNQCYTDCGGSSRCEQAIDKAGTYCTDSPDRIVTLSKVAKSYSDGLTCYCSSTEMCPANQECKTITVSPPSAECKDKPPDDGGGAGGCTLNQCLLDRSNPPDGVVECTDAGTLNPLNPCQDCNPPLKNNGWSNKADLSSCTKNSNPGKCCAGTCDITGWEYDGSDLGCVKEGCLGTDWRYVADATKNNLDCLPDKDTYVCAANQPWRIPKDYYCNNGACAYTDEAPQTCAQPPNECKTFSCINQGECSSQTKADGTHDENAQNPCEN